MSSQLSQMKPTLYFLLSILLLFPACKEDQNPIAENPTKGRVIIQNKPEGYVEESLAAKVGPNQKYTLKLSRYCLLNRGFEVVFPLENGDTSVVNFRDWIVSFELKEGDQLIAQDEFDKYVFKTHIPEEDALNYSFIAKVDIAGYNAVEDRIHIKCLLLSVKSNTGFYFDLRIGPNGIERIDKVEIT